MTPRAGVARKHDAMARRDAWRTQQRLKTGYWGNKRD
jgi:hypothetical protein